MCLQVYYTAGNHNNRTCSSRATLPAGLWLYSKRPKTTFRRKKKNIADWNNKNTKESKLLNCEKFKVSHIWMMMKLFCHIAKTLYDLRINFSFIFLSDSLCSLKGIVHPTWECQSFAPHHLVDVGSGEMFLYCSRGVVQARHGSQVCLETATWTACF